MTSWCNVPQLLGVSYTRRTHSYEAGDWLSAREGTGAGKRLRLVDHLLQLSATGPQNTIAMVSV